MLSRRHDDEYDGVGDDVRDGDGSDTDPQVPLLEADGHRLGSSARRGVTVMGFVPAPTRLSIPELDWLERARSNAGGTVKVPPHRWTRHDSSAVDSARSELYSMASRQIENTKRARRERQRDEEGVLPLGSASPMDMLTRDFNERPLIPWHQTSTGRAGVLTTFVAGSGAPLIPGPPIGIDALSRELFQFDCWGTYDAGLTTSPDLFFCGLRGQGKSYCAKTIAVREIGFGRRIIVQSDRQGEWKAIADAIPGGQVVSPGKGNYLNPFAMPDSSHLKGDADRRAFRQEVLSGRKSAMMALAEAVKEPDRPFPLDKDMLSLIDQLIASYDVGPMTLEDAVRRLSDWDWVDGVYENIHGFEHYQDLARRKASEAARVFSPMVEGGTMSGMFDRESTITLDPAAPIIVFDTSGPSFLHCQLWNISRLFPTFRRGTDRCDFPAGLRAIRAASRGAEAAVHAPPGGLRRLGGRAPACQSLVAPRHLRDLSRVLLGHAAGVGLGIQGALEEPQVPLALLGKFPFQTGDPAFQVRPARRSNAAAVGLLDPGGDLGVGRVCEPERARTVLLVAADPAVHQGLLDAGRADHALAPFRQFADRHHHDVSHDAHPSTKKCRYYIDTCRSDDNIDIVSILSHGYKLMQYRYYIDSIAQPSTYRYSIDIFWVRADPRRKTSRTLPDFIGNPPSTVDPASRPNVQSTSPGIVLTFVFRHHNRCKERRHAIPYRHWPRQRDRTQAHQPRQGRRALATDPRNGAVPRI